MRTLLWIVVIVGVAAVCNDTRGASWLAIPALLAGAALLPRSLDWAYMRRQREKISGGS